MTDAGSLETVAGPRTLEEIETALERIWSVHGQVPPDVRMQIATAAVEVGANIVEHASEGLPVRIQMQVTVLPNRVQVEFADEGKPAKFSMGSPQMPDEMAESGRGLALARAVLDRLHYHRHRRNHWTLISNSF